MQGFDQCTRLNPIDISIDNKEIISSLSRYKKNKYCFIITFLLFGSSFTDNTNVIFISVGSLNNAKKALINTKIYETLGVINLSEIYNLENIKGNSRSVNAVFNKDMKKSHHFVFGDITYSVRDILHFCFCC